MSQSVPSSTFFPLFHTVITKNTCEYHRYFDLNYYVQLFMLLLLLHSWFYLLEVNVLAVTGCSRQHKLEMKNYHKIQRNVRTEYGFLYRMSIKLNERYTLGYKLVFISIRRSFNLAEKNHLEYLIGIPLHSRKRTRFFL